MPTYDFLCPKGHRFEKFYRKVSKTQRVACPTCGKPAVRQISGGAGLVFKGSGFYLTDYGRAGAKQQAEGEAKSEAKAEAKPEAKTESKPAKKAPSTDK